jgi:hypothetical protein
MTIKTFKRVEEKYLIDRQQHDVLLRYLLTDMIPDKFCINGREYTVYNIYYDTKNCDIIRHSI